MDATTAEKLEETTHGVDVDFITFPPTFFLALLSLYAPTAVASTLFLHPFVYPLNPETFPLVRAANEQLWHL